jgi:hypothetical protein
MITPGLQIAVVLARDHFATVVELLDIVYEKPSSSLAYHDNLSETSTKCEFHSLYVSYN